MHTWRQRYKNEFILMLSFTTGIGAANFPFAVLAKLSSATCLVSMIDALSR